MGHGSASGDAKWMDGVAPGLYCNDPFVVFMQSPPQAVIGEDNAFRLYFGMGGTYVGACLLYATTAANQCDHFMHFLSQELLLTGGRRCVISMNPFWRAIGTAKVQVTSGSR